MTTRLANDGTFFLPFNMGSGTGIDAGKGNPVYPDKYSVYYMWEDILKKDTVLDLISEFIFIERKEETDEVTGKTTVKEKVVFPRYHQLDVIRKTIADVEVNRTSQNYLIQHSAGSGKTNSIAWLAHRLSSFHDEENKIVFDNIIICTDRVVVDRQLQDAVRGIEHKAGLTATPKATTLDLFGRLNAKGQKEAFHLYSMKQAIEEGFILDVLANFTEYKTYYRLNKEISEDPKYKTAEAKKQIARFVELHETNIAQRVEVIVEHFRTTVLSELGGMAKAMVVTASRASAVKYRQAFEDYVTKKGYTGIHALVAFSGKVKLPDDETEYTETLLNGFSEDKLPKKFDSDDYNVLLVANKYHCTPPIVGYTNNANGICVILSFCSQNKSHKRIFTKPSTELTTFFSIYVDKCVNPCYNMGMLKRSVRNDHGIRKTFAYYPHQHGGQCPHDGGKTRYVAVLSFHN